MTGLYKQSLAHNRQEADEKVKELSRAYAALQDKTTAYADEMFSLMELHEKVRRVWADARESPRPHGYTANPSHHAEPRFGGDSVDGVVGSLNQEGGK